MHINYKLRDLRITSRIYHWSPCLRNSIPLFELLVLEALQMVLMWISVETL